jgi:hypothetical protein
MNQNILTAALNSIDNINTSTLAHILSYLPNPTVAAEMLLGVHTPVKIEESFFKDKYTRSTSIYRAIERVDELSNEIEYTEYIQKTQQVFYLTKEDKDNNVYTTERPASSRDWYDCTNIPAIGCKKLTGCLSKAEDFYSKNEPVSDTEMFTAIAQWENYGVVVKETLVDELPF